MKKVLKVLCVIAVTIAVVFTAYTQNYYHALNTVESSSSVTISKVSEGYLLDGPSMDQLFIFYPGGKVEEEAYIPQLEEIAATMDVLLVHMPFRLAFFGINQADDVLKNYQYDETYIGGHSLGGAMAAYYASQHQDDLAGVIVLAAYPTKDMGNLPLLSIVGSNDEVVKKDKIEEGKQFVSDGTYNIIKGGNHGQFGDYGYQKGDGEASISSTQQWSITAQMIKDWINEGH